MSESIGRHATGSMTSRTVMIGGRRKSVRLEKVFWELMDAISRAEETSIDVLLAQIDSERGPLNLAAAVRLFTITYFRDVPSNHRKERKGDSGINTC